MNGYIEFSKYPQVLSSQLFCASQVRIAMVGKYTGLSDAYVSVLKVISSETSGP